MMFKYDKHNKYHRLLRQILIIAVSLVIFVEAWWVVALNVGAVAVTVAVMTLPSMIVARISPEQTLKYRQ